MALSDIECKEKKLSNICQVRSTEELSGYQLDGMSPKYIAEPSTDEEVVQVLALAASSKTPLAVVGKGTKFCYGAPLEKIEWVLSTTSLVSEPIIKTDDLVAVVKAGVPLSVLQEQLNQKGLFLPIDTGVYGATVGGALAYGGGSSHRLGYGMIRDMVLGLTVALANGKVYKFGGQTVKNVAGYDVGKLFIGSKGTLGVITEVCLRVYALPPACKVLMAVTNNQDTAWKVAQSLNDFQPTVLEIYDLLLARQLFKLDKSLKTGCLLLAKYSGPVPAVDKKYQETLEIFDRYGVSLIKIFEDVEETRLWEKRANFFEENVISSKDKVNNAVENAIDYGFAQVKITIPPAQAFKMAQALEQIFQKYTTKKYAMYMPSLGIAYISFESSDYQQILMEIQALTGKLKGFMVLEKGPLSLRQEFYSNSWKTWDMKVKKFFDPEIVLNSGKRP